MRLTDALADDFTLEVMDLADAELGAGPPVCLLGGAAGGSAGQGNPLGALTARESEVLQAIAHGRTNAQIAAALFVTEGTIKSHVKHILRKLGAGNRTEAVAKFHRAQKASAFTAAFDPPSLGPWDDVAVTS
jgi:DNA-binding CsgD family transcriptional regulator